MTLSFFARVLGILAGAWILMLTSACGKEPTPSSEQACEAGTVVACVCPDGSSGTALCLEVNKRGSCECADVELDVGWGDVAPEDVWSGINGCGGVTDLKGKEPGEACGDCGEGTYLCDGKDALVCIGAIRKNPCGRCERLAHALGDLCGPCGQGSWSCSADGSLVCAGDREINECGGCSDLSNRANFICEVDGEEGLWKCANSEQLRCVGPGRNLCGGTMTLAGIPGQSCGACSRGRWFCDGFNAVACANAEVGVNACGGCAPLDVEPGIGCGDCGGVWACDGTERLKCSATFNLCGACSPLAQTPGDVCGEGLIVACQGTMDTACVDASQYNPCGGTLALPASPGASCGLCGDGYFICGAPNLLYCYGARAQANSCGGCTPLESEPGEACGSGQIWVCDPSGEALQCLADESIEPVSTNVCGGTLELGGKPGDTCNECGQLWCSSIDANRLVCLGGTVGLERDMDHCGSCGNRCEAGQICRNGTCTVDQVISIAAGFNHTCALRRSGSVLCWGEGTGGALGNGSTSHQRFPVDVLGLYDAVALSAGESFTCAERATGDVACWGSNARQRLGLPLSVSYLSIPVNIPALYGVRSIGSTSDFSCGINAAGRVICWGDNRRGQLGRGETSDSEEPDEVLDLEGAVDLTVNSNGACAVLDVGTVWCWGSGLSGVLGNGSTQDSHTPVQVTGLTNAVAIESATSTRCALLDDGEVWCWGRADEDQIPDGRTPGVFGANLRYNALEPVPTVGLPAIASITGGHAGYYFARDVDDGLWTWGRSLQGAFMLGSAANQRAPQPIELLDGPALVEQTIGRRHSCALMDSGSVLCSGLGVQGARGSWPAYWVLADNQFPEGMDRHVPTPVIGIAPVLTEAGSCRDGIDNDGNGAVDCDDDACSTDLGAEVPVLVEDVLTTAEGDYFRGSCGLTDGRERVYRWTAPATGDYTITTEGSEMPTTVYVLDTCRADAGESAELGCSAFAGELIPARITLSATGSQTYYIVVDTRAGTTPGGYILSIAQVP